MKPEEYYYNVQVLTMREYQKWHIAHRDQNVGQWKNLARWSKDELMEKA
jgi:starvation-inducible outer membrane lipoprotein